MGSAVQRIGLKIVTFSYNVLYFSGPGNGNVCVLAMYNRVYSK